MSTRLRARRNEDRFAPRRTGSLHFFGDAQRQSAGNDFTDWSGNGRDATEVGSVTLTAGAMNGNNQLNFDGTTDAEIWSTNSWGDFKKEDAWHFFMVIEADDNSATQDVWAKGDASDGIRLLNVEGASPRLQVNIFDDGTGGISVRVDGAISSRGTTYLEFLYDGSEAASGVDLIDNGTTQTLTTTQDNLTGSITVAADAALAERSDAANRMDGRIGLFGCWFVGAAAGNPAVPAAAAYRTRRQALRRFELS